jgi:hypothetical protein
MALLKVAQHRVLHMPDVVVMCCWIDSAMLCCLQPLLLLASGIRDPVITELAEQCIYFRR